MQTFVSWESWMEPIPIGSACFMLCGFWKYHMTAVLKSLGKSIVVNYPPLKRVGLQKPAVD